MQPSSTLRRLALVAVVSGAAITATPALANAASTCTFSPNSSPARVDVFDGSGIGRLDVNRSGNSIVIADVGGPLKTCPGPNGNATVFNTDQIIVHANPAFEGDFYSVGTLGPGKTPEADGHSELETVINSGTPTRLAVFGTPAADTMRATSGGGVMLGNDADVDVRDFSANEIHLQGDFGDDFLSGRGGAPASIPGPATVKVTMFGEEGNDTLVDGPLPGDQLQGNEDNDTLFSHDFKSLDIDFGQQGFDQATMDPGDSRPLNDIEQVNVVGIGHLKLSPKAIKARAGRPARVTLAWKHPKAWKQLRSLKLIANDGGRAIAWIAIKPASGRITDKGALDAARGSAVTHHGKWLTADLRLRASKRLAGNTLRLAVVATDVHGKRQIEPLAGSLAVTK